MHIKNGKAFWAGLMFIGFGLAFGLVAQNYPMGSAVRMGPAYFPTVLGGMLVVLGAIIFLRAFFSKFEHPLKVFIFRPLLLVASIVVGGATYLASGPALSFGGEVFFAHNFLKGVPMVQFALAGASLLLFIGTFGARSMFLILLATVIFGYVLKPLGLVLAIVILIVVSAAGGHDFRTKEIAILTTLLAVFSVYAFVKGLGLPFNLWPGE